MTAHEKFMLNAFGRPVEETREAVSKIKAELETKRADQLATNCHWLLEQFRVVHEALCPEKFSTNWQEEVTQAVEASLKHAKQ